MAVKVKNLKKNFRTKQQGKMLKSIIKPNYKKVEAVKGVSFEIKKGEAVAFLGPNGAGKTTTIKMMTGLIYPSSGQVEVLGYVPFKREREFLRRIGLVMGNKAGLNWDLTARQSCELIKSIYKLENNSANKRIDEISSLLDVAKLLDTPVRNLSLGERMKMELMASILHNPEILFLDEPTIGLDILTKKKVRRFLRHISKQDNITLILTSHDMDDIEEVCDRVIIINKGEKCFDDSMDSLLYKYRQNRYLRFVLENSLSEEALVKLREWGELEKGEEEGSTDKEEAVYFFKTDSAKMISLVTNVISENNVLDMQIESVPLEDIIADLFN